MAIGIPLQPGQVPHSHLPWRVVGTVFARQTMALKAGILRVLSVTRVLWKRLASAKDHVEPRARPRQRQRANLTVFEQKYESLVDLLCASAHEGIHSERESAYKELRAWMLTHYPGIAPHISTHWRSTVGVSKDPFQTLFCYARLEDAINAATGIDDIMTSRNALEAYRNELDLPLD